jgi:DNA-binding SARP family transcriptional activator
VSPEFTVLGPIQIHGEGGGAVRIPRGRVLSFLALLLVHRGATVPLDRIVDELWDGEGPRNAKNAVHVVASRLRAAIGEGAVVSQGGGYTLRLCEGALDSDRFEQLLRRGREQRDRGAAASILREALAMWRGAPFADVADEGFAQPEIARLEDLRLTCIAERVDADLACGRHEELTGELHALVHRHPLRERFRGQLMLALYRAGRQADALAAYRDAHRALADGLGIEPSPELRALEAAILRQQVPGVAPPPRSEPITWSPHGWQPSFWRRLSERCSTATTTLDRGVRGVALS